MAKCDMEVEIEAPVESVWALTQQAERRKEWDFRINRVSLLNAATPGKGVIVRSEGRFMGSFFMEFEYVSFELNRCSAVKLVRTAGVPFVSGGGTWRYEEIGAGRCRFRTTLQMFTGTKRGGGWTDRFVLEPFLKWMTRVSLRKLKRVAEQGVRKQDGARFT